MDSVAALAGVPNTEISNKIAKLENDNSELKKAVDDLRKLVFSLQVRVESLETAGSSKPKPEPPKVHIILIICTYNLVY